jgi:hypothetical protein
MLRLLIEGRWSEDRTACPYDGGCARRRMNPAPVRTPRCFFQQTSSFTAIFFHGHRLTLEFT